MLAAVTVRDSQPRRTVSAHTRSSTRPRPAPTAAGPSCAADTDPSSTGASVPRPTLSKPGELTELPANSQPTRSPASVVRLANQALWESPDTVTSLLPDAFTAWKIASRWLG